jgi:hypothetical protein
MARPKESWPLYFAKKALETPRLKIKEGQLFPFQDKFVIKGYARGYGADESLPFGELPYVIVLQGGEEIVAKQIVALGLNLRDAKKLVGEASK